MSAAAPTTRGKPVPRWSVVRPSGLLPALIAGLPACSARVRVGPPLNASGPSCAFTPRRLAVPETVTIGSTAPISELVAFTVNAVITVSS